MQRGLTVLAALAVVAAGVAWYLSRPHPPDPAVFDGLAGNAERGRMVFVAGGCASCHAAADAKDEAKLVLAGGQAFPSDFGTFYAPNISTDPDHGIGGWTAADLLAAMQAGVSPEGKHYYPAFPYTSYIKATPQDVLDLHAYMETLPASDTPSKPHDVGFPFNIRRTLGLWKLLYLKDGWAATGDLSPEAARGRYLSEALGHCGECHSPRGALGGIDTARWLAGAPNPTGRGNIPNITPAGLDWTEADIIAYLETGFTPEFDTAGGHMVAVIENTAQLPPEDRAAIAAYLKAVPGIE